MTYQILMAVLWALILLGTCALALFILLCIEVLKE